MNLDPWRYTCPECLAHGALVRRVTAKAENNWSGEGPHQGPYYCRTCNQRVEGKYDKRDDTIVDPDGRVVDPDPDIEPEDLN